MIMPTMLHDDSDEFPSPHEADKYGIVAFGGDFSSTRLLRAYRSGIFPWPHEGLPLLWFCPDPRFVLSVAEVRFPRSLAKAINKSSLVIKADENFLAVMHACQQRSTDSSTWITDDLIDGYNDLHAQGYAHSIEAYEGSDLVGGLYGVSLGAAFFAESMFYRRTDSSKIALLTLLAHLHAWQFRLFDCQAHSLHLERFGAREINRSVFLKQLSQALRSDDKRGRWQLTMTPREALQYLQHHVPRLKL